MRVEAVVPGSPAERAGVAAGDVLLRLEGRPVASLRDYAERLRAMAPGQAVRATFVRGGKEIELVVTLAER